MVEEEEEVVVVWLGEGIGEANELPIYIGRSGGGLPRASAARARSPCCCYTWKETVILERRKRQVDAPLRFRSWSFAVHGRENVCFFVFLQVYRGSFGVCVQ